MLRTAPLLRRPVSRQARTCRSGFSLIEMLVVLIIMGLIAALVAPRLMGNVGKSKVRTTKAQIQSLSVAISEFYLDMGRYPAQEEGLSVLVKSPAGSDSEKWDGPYIEKDTIPKDGWSHNFEYVLPDDGRFIVRSLGADGKVGGENENADLDNRT